MIALPDVVVDAQIYSSNNSVVYRGIKLSDRTPVILKVLKQDYPTASELTRYRQEYEITRSLNLEGAIKAYSQQEYQRTLIIILEDFGGESLERWIEQRPDFCPMPLSAFLSLAIKITGILGRIHAAGVIHKDINPSNIVFNLDTGVGKSALVQELYKPITAKRGYFVSGKFDQFGSNIPYSAIAHALQKLVQQLLGEPDEQLQQWRSRLLAALGSNGQLIIDAIPEIELIIGKQTPVTEVGVTEAQNRFNRVFGKFIRVFCSESHPLVIFLDDLQWIDSATLKLIELMVLDEQTQHLFLIGAYRDNEVNSTHPLALMLER